MNFNVTIFKILGGQWLTNLEEQKTTEQIKIISYLLIRG